MATETEEETAFEERADYLEDKQLEQWNIEVDFFRRIQEKLTGTGAKLLVGPRGCGKTHQMRIAYRHSLEHRRLALPIFVSFNRYYWLEPLLHRAPDAIRYFHAWVLSKTVLGALETARQLDVEALNMLPLPEKTLEDFVGSTETGIHTGQDEVISEVTIERVVNLLETLTRECGRKRAILLLDDAALTLTPDYLVEFFDIFRSLKTRMIAPKASVYPGTTEYGPRFHVGQDAEAVKAWFSVLDETYSNFMDSLVAQRLQTDTPPPSAVLELFKYSSFGIPRAFIVLYRQFIQARQSTSQGKFNAVIDERAQLIEAEYLSLGNKMPQYRTIVKAGWDFFTRCVEELTQENRKATTARQLTLGIADSDDHKIGKMISFLAEAGLLFELPPVRHGTDRRYKRYIPHLLFLIKSRAFSSGRGFSPDGAVERIRNQDAKHPLRRSFAKILGKQRIEMLHLDSPPCQTCGISRISDEQRFCHNCGAELASASAFEACMQMPIRDLPISENQKQRIESDTPLKVLGDFFTRSDPATALRQARMIGEVRGNKIYETAKRVVEEFLEG